MQIIAGICIVFLCIGIAPTARGFSVHQRASSAIVSASHANTFSPKPNLGNRQYNRRHNRFPIEILKFSLYHFARYQSTRISSRNATHAQQAFGAYQRYNVRHMFDRHTISHNYAIYRMVDMVIAVHLAEILPIVSIT